LFQLTVFSLSLSLSFFDHQLHYINRSVYLFIYQSNYILYFFLFHYIDRKYQIIFIFPLRQYIYFPIIYLFQSVTTTSVKMKNTISVSCLHPFNMILPLSWTPSFKNSFIFFLAEVYVCMGGGPPPPIGQSKQSPTVELTSWTDKHSKVLTNNPFHTIRAQPALYICDSLKKSYR